MRGPLRWSAVACIALALGASGCRKHRGRARAAEPPGVAASLADKAQKTGRAFGIVQSLVDEVGPRLAGSEADARAVAWAVQKMKALGLSNVHTEHVEVSEWRRGPAHGRLVAPVTQPLSLVALGGSIGTPEQGVEADVVRVESIEALDALPREQVVGKIVFFDKPMARTKSGEGYGKAVDVRGRGAVAAAKKGAVAVLIRSIGTGPARMPHTGGVHYQDDLPDLPAAALALADADILRRTIERTGGARVSFTLGCRTLPIHARSSNVIGEVRGSERPDEIVLIGAHLDSWDLGHGAVDDGAGVAAVLETGRLLAELTRKPRRTVRVVLFANEEAGLDGAKAYAKEHAAEIDKHVLGLEVDLGAGRVYGVQYLAGPNAGPIMAAAAAPLAALGVAAPVEHAAHGADLWPLRNRGVPVVDLMQDASLYFDVHHTADDTLDKIVPAELDQVVASVAAFTFSIADGRADLGRIPEDKRGK